MRGKRVLKAPRFTTDEQGLGRAFSEPPTRVESWRAWVPLGSGCDEFCTYCVVPFARGKEWWRPVRQIVDEVRRAVSQGAREVILLGQNVNAFGRTGGHASLPPRNDRGQTMFVDLLERIENISGDFWLRFTSPHPAQMGGDFVEFFARSKKLAPNLHVPLQSGSSRILEAMNRSHNLSGFTGLMDGLRAARPEATYTTDIIVGFPGETEQDFQATMSALQDFRFLQVFAARFSPRAGTAAANMPDDVSVEEKARRWELVNELQRDISRQHYQSLLGAKTEVLFESEKRGRVMGRTARLENISVPAGTARPGDCLPVLTRENEDFSARGELVT